MNESLKKFKADIENIEVPDKELKKAIMSGYYRNYNDKSPFKKYASIASVITVIVIAFIFFIIYSHEKELNNEVASELIKAESASQSQIIIGYSFEEAVQTADAIALVEIQERLEETNHPSPKTFYNAEVKQIFKGEELLQKENIIVQQMSNSKQAILGIRPFQQGSKKILFLNQHSNRSNTFSLVGEQGHYYELNGNDIIKEIGDSEDLQEIQKDLKTSVLKYEVKDEVIEIEVIQQIFNKDDFISFLQEKIKE